MLSAQASSGEDSDIFFITYQNYMLYQLLIIIICDAYLQIQMLLVCLLYDCLFNLISMC